MATSLIFPSLLLILAVHFHPVFPTTFTLINKCTHTVWPGILSGAGGPQLSPTGFSLLSGANLPLSAPPSWSGRIWARTHCSTNSTTGKFSCLTGDCASGTVECSGAGAIPPATLVEFTLNGYGGLDFYDVSLVDGYNLPVVVVPQGGANCSAAGCYVDLNGSCPLELRLTTARGSGTLNVACKSACEAFRAPEYCCIGDYSTPSTCKPSDYSEYFKSACPSAYSYAYDDATSTFTCSGADYVVTFCPTPASTEKSAWGASPAAAPNPPNPVTFATTTSSSMAVATKFTLILTLASASYNLFL